jgi:hypothetical protein
VAIYSEKQDLGDRASVTAHTCIMLDLHNSVAIARDLRNTEGGDFSEMQVSQAVVRPRWNQRMRNSKHAYLTGVCRGWR